MWPGDRDTALLVKGAVTPTTMGNASALQHLTTHFVASLAPVSAAAILLERTLQLSFDGAGTISVPAFVADASGASFVGEGAPIPARSLLAQPLLLDPSKLATISALTNEVISGSAGNAQKMVEDVLTRSVGLALDAAMFDASAAVSEVRPAGLRNGVVASTASALTNPTDAMIADIKTLTAVVAPVSGTEPIVLVASPARAKTMPLHSLALEDGSSFIVLPSAAVASGDLIAIAPLAIVSAVDGVPEVSVSRETVLHMEDTTPAQIVSAGTPPVVAAPTRFVFSDGLSSAPMSDVCDMGQTRSACAGVADNGGLVNAMDERARAILDEARDTLHRVRDVRVERRAYHDDDDDALTRWSRGMPRPEPTPTLTAADVERTVRAALPGIATVLHEVRQQIRGEFSGSLAKLRKLVADDRTLARHELNRQRADHDRQRASMLAEIEHQRAKVAALELRVEALTHRQTVEGKVIDLPSQRRG